MKISNDDLLDSIGNADERYVAEVSAVRERGNDRRLWSIVGAAAAAVLVAVGAVMAVAVMKPKAPDDEKSAYVSPGPTGYAVALPTGTPDTVVKASDTADPAAQFPGPQVIHESLSQYAARDYLIFDSAYYALFNELEDAAELLGERVGEITALRDGRLYFDHGEIYASDLEIIPAGTAMPYEEHTGGRLGAVYAARGYSPDVIVCQEGDYGTVLVYYKVFAHEHVFGRDLFETDFSVGKELESLQFLHETIPLGNECYQYVYDDIDPELYGDRISAFVDALNEARWEPETEVFGTQGVSTRDRAGWVRLKLKNGMAIDFALWENGRVFFYKCNKLNGGMVLCLDASASEGIAELIRGKHFISGQTAHRTTLEDCMNDAWLGLAVPRAIPSGCELRSAGISPYSPFKDDELVPGDTTREISLILCGEGGADYPWIDVDVVSWDDRASFDTTEEFVPIGEFTAANIIVSSDPGELWELCIFLRVGNAAVRITAIGASAALIMELVSSIPR